MEIEQETKNPRKQFIYANWEDDPVIKDKNGDIERWDFMVVTQR